MKTRISDVFFDLDHTLWDFEKNSALAFKIIFEKHQIALNLERFLEFYVPINHKYWEWFREEKITREELRYGRFKEAFDLMQYEIDDALIDMLSDEYIYYLPHHNHLFDGAVELLEYLRPKYRLHIITNGFSEVQAHKINNSNIGHYFETVTNSEMAGVKKPNPLIFEYALQLANAKKETSIMIGDCIEADVRGALQFGIDAILFSEIRFQTAENIKQVSHLSQLKNYL